MILNYQTNDEIHGYVYTKVYHQTKEKSNEDIKQLPENFFTDLFETDLMKKLQRIY